eukprot:2818826-Rhodomonas_salina.1
MRAAAAADTCPRGQAGDGPALCVCGRHGRGVLRVGRREPGGIRRRSLPQHHAPPLTTQHIAHDNMTHLT